VCLRADDGEQFLDDTSIPTYILKNPPTVTALSPLSVNSLLASCTPQTGMR
jgi:hypothetical protein